MGAVGAGLVGSSTPPGPTVIKVVPAGSVMAGRSGQATVHCGMVGRGQRRGEGQGSSQDKCYAAGGLTLRARHVSRAPAPAPAHLGGARRVGALVGARLEGDCGGVGRGCLQGAVGDGPGVGRRL
jgi:hypothetical protein